jgi:hypothetical protein
MILTHEIVINLSPQAEVCWRLDRSWRIWFQAYLHGAWQPSISYHLRFSLHGSWLPIEWGIRDRSYNAFYTLILEATFHIASHTFCHTDGFWLNVRGDNTRRWVPGRDHLVGWLSESALGSSMNHVSSIYKIRSFYPGTLKVFIPL